MPIERQADKTDTLVIWAAAPGQTGLRGLLQISVWVRREPSPAEHAAFQLLLEAVKRLKECPSQNEVS